MVRLSHWASMSADSGAVPAPRNGCMASWGPLNGCTLLLPQVVVLNDIHIDIMDYINPATVADVQFRSMWAEFEWENKVRSCACSDLTASC